MANSGEIVTISDSNISLDSMYLEIKDTIAYTREFADNMQVTLGTAIEDLQASVGEYYPDKIDIDTDIVAIDRPVFPQTPVFSDYSSDIRDQLIAKVLDGLISGGTGLTDAVHSSIIERERESRRLAQDSTYRAALDGVGGRGFNLPSGSVAAVQSAMAAEILKADQDSLNNVTIKDFELAQRNTEFITTTAVELEKTLVDTWSKIEDTKVSVYNAEIQGVIGQYDALSKWANTEIERIKVEADIAVKNEDIALQAYTAMSSLAEKVAAEIGGIASQSIASALGAINTTLSNSYTGSEGRKENWSNDVSLRENHSYEHDPVT